MGRKFVRTTQLLALAACLAAVEGVVAQGRAGAVASPQEIAAKADECMASSGYDSSRRIIKNRASGYVTQGEALLNALPIDTSIPYAAGAIASTADDLLRWDQALYTDKLLSRASLDEMFTHCAQDTVSRAVARGLTGSL